MSSISPKISEDLLSESWIELSNTASSAGVKSPDRFTPLPFSSCEEYLRLLREAQREAQRDSNHSSRVVSLASSRRDSPRDSPKSPPNSPNSEHCADEQLDNIYINYWNKDGNDGGNVKEATDWLKEWSNNRLEQRQPSSTDLNIENEQKKKNIGFSIRLARLGKNSIFSREVLYSLLFSNVVSLLLGTGIGLWLSKRGILLTRVVID